MSAAGRRRAPRRPPWLLIGLVLAIGAGGSVAAIAAVSGSSTDRTRVDAARAPTEVLTPSSTSTPSPSPAPEAAASPAPTPLSTASPPTPAGVCRVDLDGVAVRIGSSERTRTVVTGAGPGAATVGFYARDGRTCEFRRVFRVPGRVGYGGIVDGRVRRQGSGATPAGTYTMTESFGNWPKPPTAMPFHRVEEGDWWVQDNDSRHYNDLRNEREGGFRATTEGANGSEYLPDWGRQYAWAVVINFNRAPDVQRPKRGSGIFLHVHGEGLTSGCVSIRMADLRRLLADLQPGDRITIRP